MTDYEQVRYEIDGRVARVILDRPHARNAQSRLLREEMDDAFNRAVDDHDVGVIVLSGAGESFSAGHDLGTPEEQADRERRPYEEGMRGNYERSVSTNVDNTLRWRELPKPTIAMVHGYCIYGGWMIASAMDLIFAAEDAMFLGSNFQYFSTPWDIHPRKAKELLFEGRFIDGREAERLGLVNRVYGADQLEAETMAYAHRVAENDPFQLRMTKLAVNQAQEAQGFTGAIRGALPLHLLSAQGERDPGFAIEKPEGRRRPMVQRAVEHYELHREAQQAEG
jgi:enoyl-CoA hydratase